MKVEYAVEISPTGYASLHSIKDKKALRGIGESIDGLARNPEDQGKALLGEFEGIRSLRSVRSRYRILYSVNPRRKIVSVLLVAERKAGMEADVYAVAKKLWRAIRGEEE